MQHHRATLVAVAGIRLERCAAHAAELVWLALAQPQPVADKGANQDEQGPSHKDKDLGWNLQARCRLGRAGGLWWPLALLQRHDLLPGERWIGIGLPIVDVDGALLPGLQRAQRDLVVVQAQRLIEAACRGLGNRAKLLRGLGLLDLHRGVVDRRV